MPLIPSNQRIFFRQLDVSISIGVHEFEKSGLQRVLISLNLELQQLDPEHSDNLEEVLDYDSVYEIVSGIASSRHFNLLETLCAEIARAVMVLPRVSKIHITAEKPDVYNNCSSVGFQAIFERDNP